MPRTIFHVDMDAFFVSVEEIFNPDLIGKPVVVGGGPNDRGVVSAASYAARKFGVRSALPLRTAAKLCPHAIFIPGSPHRYREYSHRVFEVLESFTPRVSMASIDEAYLDLTGTERLHGPPLAAAQKLRTLIRNRTGLPSSIGIATARLVAKVASDQSKPRGILWVLPGEEAAFLAPLEVRKIPGIGQAMEKHLHSIGIRRVGDLAGLDVDFLEARFGKWGLALAGKAQGTDAGGWFDGEIGTWEPPKSISHEYTFDTDTADEHRLESVLAELSSMVARRLRAQHLHARTIQLKLRSSDFTTITRARTLDHGTWIDTEIYQTARALFRANWKRGSTVRLLGVQAGSLDPSEGQQDLFQAEASDRWNKALSAADKLRAKFGDRAVTIAPSLNARIRERVHENPAGLPGPDPESK